MNIVQSTTAYESWLRTYLKPVANDLHLKHEFMRKDPFTFFRATFYRWSQLWQSLPSAVTEAPTVLGIGDAHVENFGTWRDREARLVWGVNDFDEASAMPYTNDLVRLAVSGLLACERGMVRTSPGEMLAALLMGYSRCLAYGGCPFVIEERNPWLRKLAHSGSHDPQRYWAKLTAIGRWRGQVPKRACDLLCDAPRDAQLLKIVHRVSGAGSLGRPRFAALFDWRGGYMAREVKARAPSAWLWANSTPPKALKTPMPEAWKHAVRCQDPSLGATRHWTVRRLAPDCSRIDLEDPPHERQEVALLRAMGWELANIHLGSAQAPAVREHLASLRRNWLGDSCERMRSALRADFLQWQRHRSTA